MAPQFHPVNRKSNQVFKTDMIMVLHNSIRCPIVKVSQVANKDGIQGGKGYSGGCLGASRRQS